MILFKRSSVTISMIVTVTLHYIHPMKASHKVCK